jgi:hypothetical protein
MSVRALLFWIMVMTGVLGVGAYGLIGGSFGNKLTLNPAQTKTPLPSQSPSPAPTEVAISPETAPIPSSTPAPTITPKVVVINTNLEREPQMVVVTGKDGFQKTYTWTDGSSISLAFDVTPDGKTSALMKTVLKESFPVDRKFKVVWGDIPKSSNESTDYTRKGKTKSVSDIPPEGTILEIDGDFMVGLRFLEPQ